MQERGKNEKENSPQERGKNEKENSLQERGRKKIRVDQVLTGKLLRRRIDGSGLKVRDVQRAMGFEHPQSIYRWFGGQALPSVDNLYILHTLLELPMEEILITTDRPQRLRCAAYLEGMEELRS